MHVCIYLCFCLPTYKIYLETGGSPCFKLLSSGTKSYFIVPAQLRADFSAHLRIQPAAGFCFIFHFQNSLNWFDTFLYYRKNQTEPQAHSDWKRKTGREGQSTGKKRIDLFVPAQTSLSREVEKITGPPHICTRRTTESGCSYRYPSRRAALRNKGSKADASKP